MGRYDHLKSKPKPKRDVKKMVRIIALVLLLAMALAGFIIRLVMQTR